MGIIREITQRGRIPYATACAVVAVTFLDPSTQGYNTDEWEELASIGLNMLTSRETHLEDVQNPDPALLQAIRENWHFTFLEAACGRWGHNEIAEVAAVAVIKRRYGIPREELIAALEANTPGPDLKCALKCVEFAYNKWEE